ncbi:MAG TPA: fructosamine kinase family protein [Chryseosolibacter sp.]
MVASIPPEVFQQIEMLTNSRITAFAFAGGGCINRGGRLTTDQGRFFLKWNDAIKFPGMFASEARGLSLLRACNSMTVPEVIHEGFVNGIQFLLLEYIDGREKASGYWEHFGAGLALLHRQPSATFGLDHDNYIGALPQSNSPDSSWVEFFVGRRLQAQLDLALNNGKIDHGVYAKFQNLFQKLPSLLPQEAPSLLHGDLWGGNLMTDGSGQPCLIDPAVYYGHREVDLAMTQLFGGFDRLFFESYNNGYPLIPGYRERFDIYNLYPLLVHLNLFGRAYHSRVVSILEEFV